MILLDGKSTSEIILQDLKTKISHLKLPPRLDIILVGDHPASLQYISMKQKKAEYVGVKTNLHHLPANTQTCQIIDLIQSLNSDADITGIMVQLPLPPSINELSVLSAIDPKKDVDGLTPTNLGLLFHHHPKAIVSATPLGIMTLLNHYHIPLLSKDVVIIGRSPYIGLPLAALMLHQNATVTICHSQTQNVKAISLLADIVISAVGKPKFITADMVKEGSIVVDIGLSPDPQTGKLVGDVDYSNVSNKCSYITPVPGGIGPMTVVSLLLNIYQIYQQ